MIRYLYKTRLEITGVIVEVKDHDQYSVRVDGTGRLTLRNRKFLRSYQPINRCYLQEKGKELTTSPTPTEFKPFHSPAPIDNRSNLLNIPTPEDDTTTNGNSPVHRTTLPVGNPIVNSDPPCEIPTKLPPSPGEITSLPNTPTQTAPRLPPVAPQASNDAPRRRTQREVKPNPKYSSELWDLSPVHYVPGYAPRGW